MIDISFSSASPKSKFDVLIIPVFADKELGEQAQIYVGEHNGYIQNYLEDQTKFTGKSGQVFILVAPQETLHKRYILVGLGKEEALKALDLETVGGKLSVALSSCEAHSALLDVRGLEPYVGGHISVGLKLARYSFKKYKTDSESKAKKDLKLKIISDNATEAKDIFAPLEASSEGISFARDLVNEPPNMLYPESYAKIIKDELKPLGVKITILDEKKMLKMGMGGIMAVGMASARQPRMVIMEWKGDDKSTDKPLGFVGKGVTFDTGGISMKPPAGMDMMKMDMGGSAAVVGVMKSLALRKAKVNVVSVVGLAENMPDGTAYRPGDIITSYAGKTVEILNTDAEGRLVLMDALTYIQQEFDPQLVIDLATLTGAIMVALGHEYSGTYANTDTLWTQLEKASDESGDKLWRMPLDDVYKKEMDSTIADLKNLGGKYAGSCTAAGFLEKFIDKDRPWAHLDIAGTAYINSAKPTIPKGGTGAGVRVLDTFVRENYG